MRRFALVLALFAAFGLVAAACGSDDDSATPETTEVTDPPTEDAVGTEAEAGGGDFVINVTKSVEAEGFQEAPYSVNITCTNESGTTAGPYDLEINDTETVPQSVNFGDTCTVTETDDLGADSVSYSCAADFQATCDDDQTVTIDQSDNGGAATVTILNTFDS